MSQTRLFDAINKRVEIEKETGDQVFLTSLLVKFEFFLKLIASAMIACIEDDVARSRYSLEHRIVHLGSLGEWSGAWVRGIF